MRLCELTEGRKSQYQRDKESCRPGYRKVGKKASPTYGPSVRVNDCEKIKEEAEQKSTKAEAKYQDTPKNGQRCDHCTMWRPPHGCSAVKGVIAENGWCSYYKRSHKKGLAESKMNEDNNDDELYGLKKGDDVKIIDGKYEGKEGHVIDMNHDTQELELLLHGPSAGRTVTVHVHDTEYIPKLREGAMKGSNSDIRRQISRYEELALAANRAGDDEKTKQYQKKIQALKQQMSQNVAEDADNPADVGEYDREGDMAKQDLAIAADAANELRSMLSDDENLPEWVQAKITRAVEYLDSARDYMKAKRQGVAEAAKWRRDDLEGNTWRSPNWDDGDLSPSKIKIDRSGKDVDDSGDELTSRPGAWRGKADMTKRMTKKGVPTKSELAFQDNLKMRMRMKKKQGGLTGPKGNLPEQGVAEGQDLNKQALDVADKLTTGKNLEKLRGMAFDSTVYRALDRYFEKYNVPETIYNRVAAIVFERINQQGVAEANTEQTFTVVYYSPKTDRNVTTTVKANNESEVWDKLALKGIQVISVE